MRTLCELIDARAAEHGSRPFLFWADQTFSFSDLQRRSEHVAAMLAGRGVQPGDRVGLWMVNSPEWLFAFFGIMRAGATAVPINPALVASEAAFILDNAGVDILFSDQHDKDVGRTRVAVPPDGSDAAALPPLPVNPDALAALIYTSGTTGQPKGVMLRHSNYLANVQAMTRAVRLSTSDRFLCILPLFHVNGQVVTTLGPLYAGAQMVLLPRFAPDTFLSDVARYKATAFSAVPTVYAILLQRPEAAELDLSALRFGICGAAPMPVEVFEAFEKKFKIAILEGYGLSEGTCVSSVNPVDGPRKVGSIGLPIPGQEMTIVDEQDRPVPPGTIGEIVIDGPNVCAGYFGNMAATEEAMRGGWWHTGDLGVKDADGYFTIVGRKKDMIIRGGENIYPREVEEVLYKHPAVQDVAVLGFPDPVWGEEVVAVVSWREGAAADVASLEAWCAEHLAGYKRPRRYITSSSTQWQRTATGKLQKNRLLEQLLTRSI